MRLPYRYAWSNPYANSTAEGYLRHMLDIYGQRVNTAATFRHYLEHIPERPDIMLFWGFCRERVELAQICCEYGINAAYWEEGFFPHYKSLHVDPVGFCWESSIPRLEFKKCSDQQRIRSQRARDAWLKAPTVALPAGVKKPFVLWPLQLIGDAVNKYDLNLTDWTLLLRDFRTRLPSELQLVIKRHPLSAPKDCVALESLLAELPNTVLVPVKCDLHSLLRESNAVAGANSSVLYEARLMHHKPTYAYARSWFTNHESLISPMIIDPVAPLPQSAWLAEPSTMRTEHLDDYADWFLDQLLCRQIDRHVARYNPLKLRKKLAQLSSRSYLDQGHTIFYD